MNKKIGIYMTAVMIFMASVPITNAAIVRQLQVGSRGNDVRELQQFLAASQTVYPAGLVTGYFGPMTQAAVVQFQVAYDIPQAGRVGPMTLGRINSIMASGLGLDVAAPALGNVSVQTGRTGATIGWTTSELARGDVRYDSAPIRTEEAASMRGLPYVSGSLASNASEARGSQSIAVSNLQPDTIYYYVTQAVDNSGNVTMTWPQTFRTEQ